MQISWGLWILFSRNLFEKARPRSSEETCLQSTPELLQRAAEPLGLSGSPHVGSRAPRGPSAAGAQGAHGASASPLGPRCGCGPEPRPRAWS